MVIIDIPMKLLEVITTSSTYNFFISFICYKNKILDTPDKGIEVINPGVSISNCIEQTTVFEQSVYALFFEKSFFH